MKLHKSLGHPPNGDLIRILRHGQASEAVSAARNLSCDFCELDVKWLPGWNDHASSYQLVLPFFEQETSEVIRPRAVSSTLGTSLLLGEALDGHFDRRYRRF